MPNLPHNQKTKTKTNMSDLSPLSISLDITQTSTQIPVIVDKHHCRVRLANLGEKTSEKGKMISFEYHLLDPAPTTDGGQVKPGFPIFENITLFDKNTPPGQIPDWVMPKISKRIDAMLGTGDPDNKAGKPPRPAFSAALVPDLIGKELILVVKVKTGDYTGNDVVEVIYPGDVKK